MCYVLTYMQYVLIMKVICILHKLNLILRIFGNFNNKYSWILQEECQLYLNRLIDTVTRVRFIWFLQFTYLTDSFLYICVCACSVCLTLCDPMDCSPTDSSVHGIFQDTGVKYCHFYRVLPGNCPPGIFPTQGSNLPNVIF